MARFKIIAGGQSRIFDMLDDAFTAGSAPSNAMRIQQEGVAGVHAKLWRETDGVWVGSVEGAPLAVNGVSTSRHRLRHGDRIDLTRGCALEFVDPGATRAEARPAADAKPMPAAADRHPPAADRNAAGSGSLAKLQVPSVSREARDRRATRARTEERRAGRGRPPQKASWHIVSGLVLVVVVGIVIAVRVAMSSGGDSAQDLLALAESQLGVGQPERALQTAQAASARAGGDAELLRRVAAVETKAKQAAQRIADGPRIDAARHALDQMRVFERIHLQKTPTARPACREFMRIADSWRERYAAVCERHPEASGLVRDVAALRERYVGAAQLDQPDQPEDVLFTTRYATNLSRPRYRDAVGKLDAFLARGTTDAKWTERLRNFRAQLLQEGREWFDKKVAQLDREWQRGRTDDVLSEAEVLLTEAVVDDWKPELAERVQRWRQAQGRK